MKRTHLVLLILFLVLLIDQGLKFYIKTNFYYGETVSIAGFDWANLHFVENEGMAFGITFGDKCIGITTETGCKGIILSPSTGKILLSVFRILMVGFLFYLLFELIKNKESKGLIASFTMILAGAIGNIIDSAFYGLLFSHSPIHSRVTAQFMPDDGGYADFLFGKVVDMFYFPLFETQLPQWLPIWGGNDFEFFRPVFNVADSAIFIGVVSIILFYNRFLFKSSVKEEVVESNPLG